MRDSSDCLQRTSPFNNQKLSLLSYKDLIATLMLDVI
jgi:hypothetical protein